MSDPPIVGRRTAPGASAKIARGHPLARRLVAAGHGLTEWTGIPSTPATLPATPPSWLPVLHGIGLDHSAASGGTTASIRRTAATTRVTLAVWIYLDPTTGSSGAALCWGDGAGTAGLAIGCGTTNFDTAGFNFIALQSNVSWLDSGVAVAAGWHLLTFTSDKVTNVGVFYVDGLYVATTTAGFTDVPAASTLVIGGETSTTRKLASGGQFSTYYVWERILTDGEVATLYAEPFCFFQERTIPLLAVNISTGMGFDNGVDFDGDISFNGAMSASITAGEAASASSAAAVPSNVLAETNATVTAPTPASSTSVALVPPSVTAQSNATITDPGPATSTSTAVAPTAVTSSVSVSAPTPAVSASTSQAPTSVTATTAITATVAAVAGSTALAPAAVTAETVITAGTFAAASSTAVAPTSITSAADVTSTVAASTSTAPPPPAVTAVTDTGTAAATAAASTALAPTSVTAETVITSGFASAASTAVVPDTVTATSNVDITAEAASAVSAALAPSTIESDVDITGVAASSAASVSQAPTLVTAGTGASITSPAASSNAVALAPDTVLAEVHASVTVTVPAQAAAAALIPAAVFSEATIASTLAVALAVSQTPTTVDATTAVTVGTSATATSGALAPSAVTAEVLIWLTATTFDNDQIDLDWDEPYAGVSGYEIERDGEIIVSNHPVSSYSDTGLAQDTLYCYRVRAMYDSSFDPETDIAWHSFFWAEGTQMTALGYANTDPVGTWPNETGESDATEATNKPVYLTDGGAAYNNKPVVDFSSGVNNKLVTGAFTSPPGATRTYVVIGNRGASSPTYGTLIDGPSSGASDRAKIGTNSAQSVWTVCFGTTTDLDSTIATDTVPHLFVARSSTALTDKLIVDGTTGYEGNAGANTGNGIIIGNYATPNYSARGYIALVGVYDGDLTSDSNYAAFTAWVETHYGITVV